jgi:fructose-bisphosphate aldolase, class I
MNIREAQLSKVQTQPGFLAALDQSGGSTPKALKLYGVNEDAYSNDAEMFAAVHQMRTRIISSSAFDGKRILGAILFEDTMDREIDGTPTAEFLWNKKNVVPFLKVDKGLEAEADGVQLMKAIPGLDALLERAVSHNVFGTKMRSVVKHGDAPGIKAGIEAIVAQQFTIGNQILASGVVPILEPEIDIHSPNKAEAEVHLKAGILQHLGEIADGQQVMLKLTLPAEDNFYADLIAHPKVLKVVALSGGYSRDEANARLSRNHAMIASFSRALTQGLTAQQTQEEFDEALGAAIESIFEASCT